MTYPRLSYDADVRALYIRLSGAAIVETIELSRTTYVDIDANGDPVGFEILNADPALVTRIPASPGESTWCELMKPDAA